VLGSDFIFKFFLDFKKNPNMISAMNLSTFDTQAHCEETIPAFVPTQNDLIDSLPPEILEASYRRDVGRELWDMFAPVR
jgi:hypothetical protein